MDKDLYEIAMDAIRELFGDTSVTPQQTKENLEALIDNIQIMIDTLEV